MKFCCLFPEVENIHLTKDVGMIPYVINKFDKWTGVIATFDNDKYTYLKKEVEGLNLDFIKKRIGNNIVDSMIYLYKNAKSIDVLQLYHVRIRTFIWGLVYKSINKNGKIHLKLDWSVDNENNKVEFVGNKFKARIYRKIMKKVFDVITVESKESLKYLNEVEDLNTVYLPNGFYSEKFSVIDYENKSDTIITVGRIGTYQKNTELLLEAFKEVADKIPDWKLKVIGPVNEEFKEYIDKYKKDNINISSRVEFTGEIYNKDIIDKEYKKAKVFCLTSRFEGFPLVFPEALKNGNFIITSNISAGKDIQLYECGITFENNNLDDLKDKIVYVCKNNELLKDKCSNIQEIAFEKFNWSNICKNLFDYLEIDY